MIARVTNEAAAETARLIGLRAFNRWPAPLRRTRLLMAIGLAAGLLGGCQTMAPGRADGEGAAFDVGENALGETCRVVSARPGADDPPAAAAYEVRCGGWETPSARIYRTPTSAEAAVHEAWRARLEVSFNCAAPIPTTILDGIPALALDCSLRSGGWPYQALTVSLDQDTYLADTIPTAYPALERAIGALGGRLTLTQADRASLSAEITRLEARIAGAQYSAGDLARYRDLLRLAQYFNFRGNFADAEKRYREALDIHRRVSPENMSGLAFLYMHIALQVSNQERFPEAELLFAKADELVQYSLEPNDAAKLLSYRALHMANQRADEAALALAREATAMRRKIAQQYGHDTASLSQEGASMGRSSAARPRATSDGVPDRLAQSRALTAIGNVVQSQHLEAAMLLELGQLDEAARVADEALATVATKEYPTLQRWAPELRLLRARIAERKGDLAAAQGQLRLAIEEQQVLFSRSRTEGLLHLALGATYTAQGHSDRALDAFRTGFDIIVEGGGTVRADEAMPFFQAGLAEAERHPERREAIHAEMFELGQLIRGPVAARAMALTAARLAASDAAASGLIRELQDARLTRDDLRERIAAAQTNLQVLAPQIEQLDTQWQAANARVAELERLVQAAEPRYNQLVDSPVSAEAVTAALGPDEALVQVVLGSGAAVGFIADTSGIEVYEIDLTEPEAAAFVADLRAPFLTAGQLPVYPVGQAHDLYRRLLGPVAARLAHTPHLIAVPSGPLLSLPYGLLVAASPPTIQGLDYSNVEWLVRRHALTLAPSVQSFVNLRQTVRPSGATRTLIGFGDFVPYGDTDAMIENLGLPESCRGQIELVAHIPALPNTATELRAVAKLVDDPTTALFLGSTFSEQTLRETDLAQYQIVYLATHGLLPHKLQCLPEPALAVSRSVGGGIGRDDGLLMTSEIATLKLDAGLVVLSACDTGGPGKETGGEALSGLARAFFYAGARTMLVTHWEIPDSPTVALLTAMSEHLGAHDANLAEALRAGQLRLIERPELSHPFAWAAFTVVGDGGFRLDTAPRALKTVSASKGGQATPFAAASAPGAAGSPVTRSGG